MGALLGLFEDLILRLENNTLPLGTILIFTDSAGCVGYLERGWSQPTTTNLSRDTRRAWVRLKGLRPSKLFWIRGHSGILGNDEADRLAKIAANKSKDFPDFYVGGDPPPLSYLSPPPLAGRVRKRPRGGSLHTAFLPLAGRASPWLAPPPGNIDACRASAPTPISSPASSVGVSPPISPPLPSPPPPLCAHIARLSPPPSFPLLLAPPPSLVDSAGRRPPPFFPIPAFYVRAFPFPSPLARI